MNREVKEVKMKYTYLKPERLTLVVDGILGLDREVRLT